MLQRWMFTIGGFMLLGQAFAFAEEIAPLAERKASHTVVVDQQKILHEWSAFQELESRRVEEDQAERDKIDDLSQDIAELQRQFKHAPNSERASKLVEARAERRRLELQLEINSENRRRANLEFALREIQATIKEVAERHEIGLVLCQNCDIYPSPPPATIEQGICFGGWWSPFTEDPSTATEAKALFRRKIAYHTYVEITYDVLDALRAKEQK